MKKMVLKRKLEGEEPRGRDILGESKMPESNSNGTSNG
jgi:hypothetical protein